MPDLGYVEAEELGMVGGCDLFWPVDPFLDNDFSEVQLFRYPVADEIRAGGDAGLARIAASGLSSGGVFRGAVAGHVWNHNLLKTVFPR